MLPESTNVYGVIYSTLSKNEIANRFGQLDWRVSKSSWFDWEITNDYSELIIEGDEEILIHGAVSPGSFTLLVNTMKEIGLQFSVELYDEAHELITMVDDK